MNPFTDSPYTAYIGLDWADTKHDVCLQGAGCEHREFTSLPHQVGEIESWARSLRQRFGGPIADGAIQVRYELRRCDAQCSRIVAADGSECFLHRPGFQSKQR